MALRTKTRRDKVRDAVEDARSTVQPAAEVALDKIGTATEQFVSTVASTVGPALEDAKDKALDTYKDTLIPLAQQAIVEGKVRGRRAAIKLGVADEPKKSHKLRNLLVLIGLAGLAAFAYKKVTGKDADPAWTQSRDSSATRPAHAATAPVDGSDTAPTAPLASEETVESPTPTTPDKPLKTKDV